MKLHHLGTNGPATSPLTLGCMGMSGVYGPSDDNESIATINAALDAGINLLDTGDFYGMGENELLIARALQGRRRDQVLLSVKFGAMRSPDGQFIGIDGRPAAVKNFAAYSLKRLNTDIIDIYRLARVDPNVPIEETVGAVADLIKKGYVRYVGLSEAGAATLRRAHATHPICDLQIEYSLISRGMEQDILPVARELGIAITAYGVLSRGLLSFSETSKTGDFRAHLPRFTGDNFRRNQKVLEEFAAFAGEKGVSPSELAIAWVFHKGADIFPVVGARRRSQLEEALRAADLPLSTEELQRLESIFATGKIAGTRYEAAQMRMLDSERSPRLDAAAIAP